MNNYEDTLTLNDDSYSRYLQQRQPTNEVIIKFLNYCATIIQKHIKGYIQRQRHQIVMMHIRRFKALLNAHVSGYKIRKILRTSDIVQLIQSIQDTDDGTYANPITHSKKLKLIRTIDQYYIYGLYINKRTKQPTQQLRNKAHNNRPIEKQQSNKQFNQPSNYRAPQPKQQQYSQPYDEQIQSYAHEDYPNNNTNRDYTPDPQYNDYDHYNQSRNSYVPQNNYVQQNQSKSNSGYQDNPIQSKGQYEDRPIQSKGQYIVEDRPIQSKGQYIDDDRPIQSKGQYIEDNIGQYNDDDQISNQKQNKGQFIKKKQPTTKADTQIKKNVKAREEPIINNEEQYLSEYQDDRPIQSKGQYMDDDRPIQSKGQYIDDDRPIQSKGQYMDDDRPIQSKAQYMDDDRPIQSKGQYMDDDRPIQSKGYNMDEEQPPPQFKPKSKPAAAKRGKSKAKQSVADVEIIDKSPPRTNRGRQIDEDKPIQSKGAYKLDDQQDNEFAQDEDKTKKKKQDPKAIENLKKRTKYDPRKAIEEANKKKQQEEEEIQQQEQEAPPKQINKRTPTKTLQEKVQEKVKEKSAEKIVEKVDKVVVDDDSFEQSKQPKNFLKRKSKQVPLVNPKPEKPIKSKVNCWTGGNEEQDVEVEPTDDTHLSPKGYSNIKSPSKKFDKGEQNTKQTPIQIQIQQQIQHSQQQQQIPQQQHNNSKQSKRISIEELERAYSSNYKSKYDSTMSQLSQISSQRDLGIKGTIPIISSRSRFYLTFKSSEFENVLNVLDEQYQKMQNAIKL